MKPISEKLKPFSGKRGFSTLHVDTQTSTEPLTLAYDNNNNHNFRTLVRFPPPGKSLNGSVVPWFRGQIYYCVETRSPDNPHLQSSLSGQAVLTVTPPREDVVFISTCKQPITMVGIRINDFFKVPLDKTPRLGHVDGHREGHHITEETPTTPRAIGTNFQPCPLNCKTCPPISLSDSGLIYRRHPRFGGMYLS